MDKLRKASDNISSKIAETSGKIDQATRELLSLISENEHFKECIPIVISILENVPKSGQLLVDTIESTNELLTSFKEEYESFDDAAFRASLIKFTNDSFSIAHEVTRILDKKIELPSEFLIRVIENFPKFMLFGASLVVNSIDKWDSMPGSILETLEKVPSLNQTRDKLCETIVAQTEVYNAMLTTQILTQLIKSLIECLNAILPRDISVSVGVSASIIGEGGGGSGGTELLGHPIRLPFNILIFLFKLVDLISIKYLELYEVCSLNSWQSSVADQIQNLATNRRTNTAPPPPPRHP